jgi:hypothetical protein
MSGISNFEKYISKVDEFIMQKIYKFEERIQAKIEDLIEKNPHQSVSITRMLVENNKLIVSFDMTYCVSHCDDGGDVIVSKHYAIFDL